MSQPLSPEEDAQSTSQTDILSSFSSEPTPKAESTSEAPRTSTAGVKAGAGTGEEKVKDAEQDDADVHANMWWKTVNFIPAPFCTIPHLHYSGVHHTERCGQPRSWQGGSTDFRSCMLSRVLLSCVRTPVMEDGMGLCTICSQSKVYFCC